MNTPQFEAPEIEELQDLFPSYEILEFIARGGMGAVYQARQISLDRKVAIKILPPEFGDDPEFRRGFEAEAKAMAKLNHPNLVGVYDFGEVDGMPYIVMEYVDGNALHFSAHGIAIDSIEAARLTLGICEGLAHAHQAGVLHRDIKPGNILLDLQKHPKIGDFGLACTLDSDGSEELLFGTPGYTAPEAIDNPETIGTRSDVFSVGVVLYELLTGELPGDPLVPASRKASVDARFDRIINRAIDPSPDRRFADAGEMAKELEKLLENLSKLRLASGSPNPSLGKSDSLPGKPFATTLSKSPVSVVGSNRSLIWKSAVIVFLLFAVFKLSSVLKEKRDSANAPVVPQMADVTEGNSPPDRAPMPDGKDGNDKPAPSPSVDSPEPLLSEDPLGSLTRLRSSLLRGERTSFPPTTLGSGESRYFFIEIPMPWNEAAAYAEEHGGHLATADNRKVRSLLSQKIPPGASVWLGGGPVGHDAWGWVDGSAWTAHKPYSGAGRFASLSGIGILGSKPGNEKHPFFIQWNMDGKNPGSLRAQLERTKETIGDTVTVYPPGTFQFESRNYLVATGPVTWQEARSLAELANGHLAVPSDASENDFLRQKLNLFQDDASTFLIGIRHDRDTFAWITGESWSFADWAPGFPKSTVEEGSIGFIVTGANGGWQHSIDGPAVRRSFVIEWSDDHLDEGQEQEPLAAGTLMVLQTKARKIIDADTEKHQASIRENTERLKREIDLWIRKTRKKEFEGVDDEIMEWIDSDGRIEWPGDWTPLPHRDLQEFVNSCVVRQNKLDDAFNRKLEEIRLFYCKNLRNESIRLGAKGLKGEVQRFDKEIAACGSISGFKGRFDVRTFSHAGAPAIRRDALVFREWLETVRFQTDHGVVVYVEEGAIRRKSSQRGGRPIQDVDEKSQSFTWNFGGTPASIFISPDRKSGIWTEPSGIKHQFKVIPRKFEKRIPDQRLEFGQWVRTVRFRADNGIQLFIEGDKLRMPGIRGFDCRIDEANRCVIWANSGSHASIRVGPDQTGGVWTKPDGVQHQLTVIPQR